MSLINVSGGIRPLHSSHQYGTDIDTYHFYKFPDAAMSGSSNYEHLRDAVITAFGVLNSDGSINQSPSSEATDAENQLISFVNATRTGLDNLASLDSVSFLLYALGSPELNLPSGWAKSLIQKGSVTRTIKGVSQTLDLNLNSWSNRKVEFNVVHNSHVHIKLDRQVIGEGD